MKEDKLWQEAMRTEKLKNYWSLNEHQKRIFWIQYVINILKEGGEWERFQQKERLEFERNNIKVSLSYEKLTCKGVEKNGDRVTYSLKFATSRMRTTHYNSTRFLKRALGVESTSRNKKSQPLQKPSSLHHLCKRLEIILKNKGLRQEMTSLLKDVLNVFESYPE